MEEFYDDIDKLLAEAEKVCEVFNCVKGVVLNHPINRLIPKHSVYEMQPNGEYGHGENLSVSWMHNWLEKPVVLTSFETSPEWIADHVLSVLRFRYNCTYEMEVWGSSRKIIYSTKIMDRKVMIQIIESKECTWEEIPSTTFKLNCSE